MLVAATATASCGHAAERAAPVPSTSTQTCVSPSGFPAAHVLTERDAGGHVRLHVGERLSVQLPGGSYNGYRVPHVDGDAIRQESSSGGYPSSCAMRAAYVAVAPGSATLESQTDFLCLHAKPPCLPPNRMWSVRVLVTGR